MILVIDTNILVSAALRDRDPEAVVVFAAGTAGVHWVASPQIIAEYRTVLSRPKFGLTPKLLERWFTFFERSIEVGDVASKADLPRDQADAVFLDCAIATRADFLITGDRDFGDPVIARRLAHTIIISASAFRKQVIARCPAG
jgi:putative PIN family toxin of toxin-antitoxin system